jgi:hypothetical protein
VAEFDLAFIVGGVSVVSIVLTLVFSVYYKRGDKKDKGVTDRRSLEIEVERTAGAKGIIERATAKELKENAERIAEGVKTETMAAVNQLFATLRSEIKYHDAEVKSEMMARDVTIQSHKRDFDYFIETVFKDFKNNITIILEKQQKTIEMLQTLSFGSEAHSFPKYIYGKERSAEDTQRKDEGMFHVQTDAEQTQQTSDNEERIKQDDENK